MTDCWSHNPNTRPDFNTIVTRLQQIAIEAEANDDWGSAVWQQIAPNDSDCELIPFVRYLFRCLDLPFLPEDDPSQPTSDVNALNQRCILHLLHSTRSNRLGPVVTLRRFGEVCASFGPLGDGAECFRRIRETLREPWFWGYLSSAEETRLLGSKPVGTFLIRCSTSSPGYFTLSRVDAPAPAARIGSVKIVHQPGGPFVLDGKHPYPTLRDLVSAARGILNLGEALQPNPFHSIFDPHGAVSADYRGIGAGGIASGVGGANAVPK